MSACLAERLSGGVAASGAELHQPGTELCGSAIPVSASVTHSQRSISADRVAGASTAPASVRSRAVSSAAASMAAARTASLVLRSDRTCRQGGCGARDGTVGQHGKQGASLVLPADWRKGASPSQPTASTVATG